MEVCVCVCVELLLVYFCQNWLRDFWIIKWLWKAKKTNKHTFHSSVLLLASKLFGLDLAEFWVLFIWKNVFYKKSGKTQESQQLVNNFEQTISIKIVEWNVVRHALQTRTKHLLTLLSFTSYFKPMLCKSSLFTVSLPQVLVSTDRNEHFEFYSNTNETLNKRGVSYWITYSGWNL